MNKRCLKTEMGLFCITRTSGWAFCYTKAHPEVRETLLEPYFPFSDVFLFICCCDPAQCISFNKKKFLERM